MGLSLLFPLGLVALGAGLLPLLIHLARRQESRLTEFAALRWLRAQPKPRQRIRVDEWPLLLVRLLLLALVALLLAGLAWQRDEDLRPRILVSPGIDATAQRALQLPAEAQARWLAAGFPPLGEPAPPAAQPVASLLREFDASLPAGAPLTVYVPATWGVADAQRPVLSRAVEWRVLPGRSPERASVPKAAPTLVAVGFDTQAPSLRTLRALNAAWQPRPSALATAGVAEPAAVAKGSIVAWGPDTAIPAAWLAWARAGGDLLLGAGTPWPANATPQPEWRDDNGDVLLASMPLGHGRIWRLSRGLDPAGFPRLLDARFPLDLARHLQSTPTPALATAAEFAPLHQARGWPRPPPALLPGLALLIALVFAVERWLATSPRRGAVA